MVRRAVVVASNSSPRSSHQLDFLRLSSKCTSIGITHTKKIVSWEEAGAQQLKGARGGRRAQTVFYKELKELGQFTGDRELDLHDEASATLASYLVGWKLAIRKSQVTLVEQSLSELTEDDREEVQEQVAKEEENIEESEGKSGEVDGQEGDNEDVASPIPIKAIPDLKL
ncbi:hypothetical protein Sjap_013029 [Stephania japonica]|uniref:Uncharacterized protein n=1 Tax=Stephania japonica TaxID=461633 RepID=A0AAP0NXB6_9MAGN